MLKYEVTDLSQVEENLHGLYKQDGDRYVLQVEGAAPKSKLNEFRENNVNLMKELEGVKSKLNGIDIDAFNDFMKKQQDTHEQQLIKNGKIDELVALRSEAMKTKYEHELQVVNEKFNGVRSKLSNTLIDGELAKVAASSGIKPTAIDDVLLRGKSLFSLTEDGTVVARQGDQVRYNADNKPYGFKDFVTELQQSAPHLFQESSGGGTENNKNLKGVTNTSTVSRSDKRNWDIEKIIKGEQKVV